MKHHFEQSLIINWAPVLAAVFLIFGFCSHGEAQNRTSNSGEIRVLFIGNSLTYFNNLPEIVQELAKSAKQKNLIFKMVAEPDFSLEDHWKKGNAVKLIAKEKWDFVVLQQGPSASVEGRSLLLEYSRIFANEIIRNGSKPAFYAVWPSVGRKQDFERAGESYRMAATDTKGILLPVGDAWARALKRDPKLELYSADGLHPTVAGSYLAALVIYQQLYGENPERLPLKLKLRSGNKIELSEDQAKTIREAAIEANKQPLK